MRGGQRVETDGERRKRRLENRTGFPVGTPVGSPQRPIRNVLRQTRRSCPKSIAVRPTARVVFHALLKRPQMERDDACCENDAQRERARPVAPLQKSDDARAGRSPREMGRDGVVFVASAELGVNDQLEPNDMDREQVPAPRKSKAQKRPTNDPV